MQRRKFLIGAGALAAGSAAAVGSGAFSAMQAGRDADINVVSDSNGLIALNDETPSDVIRENDNGELVIDFSGDGSSGVNVDSRYQVGVMSDKGWALPGGPPAPGDALEVASTPDPAFTIVNNDTVEHSLNAVYDANASDLGPARVFFQFHLDNREATIDVSGTTTTDSLGLNSYPKVTSGGPDARFDPGDDIEVTLFVDTRGVTDPSSLDLSGTLTIDSGVP